MEAFASTRHTPPRPSVGIVHVSFICPFLFVFFVALYLCTFRLCSCRSAHSGRVDRDRRGIHMGTKRSLRFRSRWCAVLEQQYVPSWSLVTAVTCQMALHPHSSGYPELSRRQRYSVEGGHDERFTVYLGPALEGIAPKWDPHNLGTVRYSVQGSHGKRFAPH